MTKAVRFYQSHIVRIEEKKIIEMRYLQFMRASG